MSGDITMAQVIEACSAVYTDDGVAIYLGSRNSIFDGERPIDLCRTAEGRLRVWRYVDASAHGVFG